jgi:hypothetical protein
MQPVTQQLTSVPESLDGVGAGDHDQPYRFGRLPRTDVPFPFSTRQYAHLLVLRGQVQDGVVGDGDLAPD